MKNLIIKVILCISVFHIMGCKVESGKTSPVKEIDKLSNNETHCNSDSSAPDKQNCDLFLKILTSDGYIQWDGKTNHDYNVAGISDVRNCTPKTFPMK